MTFSNPPSFLPPVLATGQGQSANGRQQLGSGLVTHRGIIDANSLRVQGWLYPQSGAGLELAYDQTSKAGYIQSYNRDTAQWTDLAINAKNITLSANGGGKVSLPAGAAQSHVVSYVNGLSWATPAAATWYETPVGGSFTSTGVEVRIEASASVYCNTLSANVYIGWGYDGTLQQLGTAAAEPAVSYQLALSFVTYGTLPAGVRRVAMFMYVNTGVATIWNGSPVNFHVTEQRA